MLARRLAIIRPRIPAFYPVRYQQNQAQPEQPAEETIKSEPTTPCTSLESLVNSDIVKEGPHKFITGFSWWGYEGAISFLKTRTNPTVRLAFKNIITNQTVRLKYSADIPAQSFGLELGVRLCPFVSFGRPKVEFSTVPEVLTTNKSWSITLVNVFIHVMTIEELPGTYFIRYGSVFGLGLRFTSLKPGKLYLNHDPTKTFEVVRHSTGFNSLSALLGFTLSVLFFLTFIWSEFNQTKALLGFALDQTKQKALGEVKF